MKGYNPPEYAHAGEMVCEARFWNQENKAKYWYAPMLEGKGDTILRMEQVLKTDIKLVEISNNNKLPKGYNKKQTKDLGTLRIKEENIDELIEEIRRRDHFVKKIDIVNNETMTHTNEIEGTDWSLLTLIPDHDYYRFHATMLKT